MIKKILLIGGGGHCKSVLDTLLNSGTYSEIGIIDTADNVGKNVMGVSVVGSDDDLLDLYKSGFGYAFVTVGSIGNTNLRSNLYYEVEKVGFEVPNIIDETSTVSRYTDLDKGIFVGKKAIINSNSSVCKGAIINTGSIVEHECTIGKFSHISPGTILCGQVHIGNNTHIGAGSTVKQQVIVGENTMVGTGSNVLSNINNNVVAYGNPCKEVYKI